MKRSFLTLCCGLLLPAGALAAPSPWIKVEARAQGRFEVAVTARTNLPEGTVLTASYRLAAQKPGQPIIASPARKAVVRGGAAQLVLSGEGSGLTPPTGTYQVVVTPAPNGSQAGPSTVGQTTVKLSGSGLNLAQALQANENRSRIFEDTTVWETWNATFFRTVLGKYEELRPVVLNSAKHHAYYFSKVDMTFLVASSGQVAMFAAGRYRPALP